MLYEGRCPRPPTNLDAHAPTQPPRKELLFTRIYKQRTGEDSWNYYSPGFISNEQGRERSLQASMTSASAATVSGDSLRLPIASIIFSAMACAFSTIDSVVS